MEIQPEIDESILRMMNEKAIKTQLEVLQGDGSPICRKAAQKLRLLRKLNQRVEPKRERPSRFNE